MLPSLAAYVSCLFAYIKPVEFGAPISLSSTSTTDNTTDNTTDFSFHSPKQPFFSQTTRST
ncbi:unnamed protein product [Chondrus crispus]|uniref:Uncharacterized protein n=1 Tax=Chondrus crispus TaxID=2769 RepID=R7Q8E6_CHOCR|nr:unnamed protein product [Chondrus crispus]CDF33656.1 unnamed protein product [Chondrus crispus]|eukprot:XP_005713475.1 unnamed protein product [Chondrus crispus]